MKIMIKNKRLRRYIVAVSVVLSTMIMLSIGGMTPACAAESRFVDFNGVRIHYVADGQGADTVVFIHGWCCDHHLWRLQVPGVAEKYRVIQVDLPGHGESDKPVVPYTQGYFVQAVEAVIEDAGLNPGRVILVGHSMGLSVARQYALKHPDRVKGLINVDGAIFRPPQEPEALKEWEKAVKSWTDAFKGPDAGKNKKEFVESMFVPATSAETRKEILDVIMNCPDHVASSAIDNMRDLSLWTGAQVEIPTLAIYAKNPHMWADNEAFIKSLFPNLEYHEWENLGHFYMLENPVELTAAMLAFLGKLDAD